MCKIWSGKIELRRKKKLKMAEAITVKIGYGQKKTQPDLKNIFIKFQKKWIDVDPVISVKQKKWQNKSIYIIWLREDMAGGTQ